MQKPAVQSPLRHAASVVHGVPAAAGAAWQNYRTYFVELAAVSGDAMTELARYVGSLPADHRTVLLGPEHHLQFRGELFEIEFPGRWRDVADPPHFLPIHEPLEAPLAIVLTGSQVTLKNTISLFW